MKILARDALTCPAVDQKLLHTYLAYMVQDKSMQTYNSLA